MQYSIITLSAFIALTLAAPYETFNATLPARDNNYYEIGYLAHSSTGDNTCGPSTFTNELSKYVPGATVIDCADLGQQQRKQSGSWSIRKINTKGMTPMIDSRLNNCHFSVQSKTDDTFFIGTSDVADVVATSINDLKMAKNNMLMVCGDMKCRTVRSGDQPIRWCIGQTLGAP